MDLKRLPHTQMMFRVHRYVVIALGIIIFIGPSISAIRIGRSPVAGVIVSFLIACAFAGLMIYLNQRTQRQIENNQAIGWINAVVASSIWTLIVVGIFPLRELLSKEVRKEFFK